MKEEKDRLRRARKNIRKYQAEAAELRTQIEGLRQGDSELRAEIEAGLEALFVDRHLDRTPLGKTLDELVVRHGVPAIRKELSRRRAPKRNLGNLIALWATVEACKTAMRTDAKKACRIIADCGGYPKVRSTYGPLAKPTYDTQESIRNAYHDAASEIRKGRFRIEGARATADSIYDGWKKTGESFEKFLREHLRRQRQHAARRQNRP